MERKQMIKNIKSKHVKYSLFALVGLTLVGYGCWCLAENFLASSAHNRSKKGITQIKQNITEKLAELLDLTIKDIQLKSQIQQKIFNNIKDLAENNKQNFIVKTNSFGELKALYNYLLEHNEKISSSLEHSYQLLKTFESQNLESLVKIQSNVHQAKI